MNLGKLDIWSTPKLAPLYPEFPIQYRNVQILTSVYETTPEAIALHIGPPLTSLNNYVMIHNYFMPEVEGMGVVEETNVMVGVSVKDQKSQIEAKVYRNAELVSHVTASYKTEESSIDALKSYFPFAQNINHKVIRNIDGTQGINQITARTLANVEIKGMWSGDVTVKLHPNKEAPFHLLPVVKNIKSFYWEADFSLVPGVIVRDFLKEQSNE